MDGSRCGRYSHTGPCEPHSRNGPPQHRQGARRGMHAVRIGHVSAHRQRKIIKSLNEQIGGSVRAPTMDGDSTK
jgi:hypothetical protein